MEHTHPAKSLIVRRSRAVSAAEVLVPALLLAFTVLLVHYEPRAGWGNEDTVIYAIAASMWSNGAVPYRDVIDHKPPGIYVFYRLCFFFGGRTPRALWQGFVWATGIAAVVVYWGFCVNRRVAAGTATALAFLALQRADLLGLGAANQNDTESLAVAWAAVAFGLVLAYQRFHKVWWAILAGAAFAAAVLSKQPAACWLVPLAAHVVATHYQSPRAKAARASIIGLLGLTLGAALVLGVCIAYFAFRHALGEFYDWVYLRNMNYAAISRGGLSIHVALLTQSVGALARRLLRPDALPITMGMLLLPIGLICRRSWLELIAVLWCVASLVAVSCGTGLADHYLIFMNFAFALAVGSLLDWLSEASVPARSRLAAALSSFVLCLLIFSHPLGSVYASLASDPAAPERALQSSPLYRMGRKIREYAQPGDRLLPFGVPLDVVFYADMMPPAKYIYWPTDSLRPDAEEFMREVRDGKPAFIYIGGSTRGAFRAEEPPPNGPLKQYVDEHYELWVGEGFGRVYRRLDRQWPSDMQGAIP